MQLITLHQVWCRRKNFIDNIIYITFKTTSKSSTTFSLINNKNGAKVLLNTTVYVVKTLKKDLEPN